MVAALDRLPLEGVGVEAAVRDLGGLRDLAAR
jgi:hypothetical protein